MEDTMLTTIDNPYNPFTQWEQWYTYDMTSGYNTCGMLGGLVKDNNEFNDGTAQLVMNDIVRYSPFNHILVTKENFHSP